MDKNRLNHFGFKKIVPTLVELRQYLYQCTYYTDKRCYIPISAGIEEFISKKNIDEMNYEQISSILLYFEMLPHFLYFYIEKNLNEVNQKIDTLTNLVNKLINDLQMMSH